MKNSFKESLTNILLKVIKRKKPKIQNIRIKSQLQFYQQISFDIQKINTILFKKIKQLTLKKNLLSQHQNLQLKRMHRMKIQKDHL
jgi:hypothetical protein